MRQSDLFRKLWNYRFASHPGDMETNEMNGAHQIMTKKIADLSLRALSRLDEVD
jgi:hypothetical protein